MDHVSDSTVSFIYEIETSCVIEENKSIIYWMSGWTWQPLSSLLHPKYVIIELLDLNNSLITNPSQTSHKQYFIT